MYAPKRKSESLSFRRTRLLRVKVKTASVAASAATPAIRCAG
jgi:hypothetical protein